MLLETVYFCESRVDIWRKLGRYLQILKDHYWFAADLCLPDWPSTEQLCVTYKNCNLKGNWAAESVSVTKCIVLVSDRSISSIYWSGLNCLKVHMYLLQICIFTVCVCVYIHTNFKMILSDFSSHWTFSPVHKSEILFMMLHHINMV